MILVTGGTGLVGAHLLFSLAEKGEKVRALIRSQQKTELVKKIFSYYSSDTNLINRIEWIEGDITDIASLEAAFNGVEFVYHCAALVSFHSGDEKILFKTNIEGTANIVNQCLASQIKKLCYVSSTAAIGHTGNNQPITETTKWRHSPDISNYSISKHYAEREVIRGIEEGLNTVIVNPCIIIGPGDWKSSSTALFKTVWKGLNFYTTGVNAFVDVRDVARSMILLMNSKISGEKFLVVSENMVFRDFVYLLAQSLGKPLPKIHAGFFLTGLAWRLEKIISLLKQKKPSITRETVKASHQHCYYSNEKIKEALQFEFIPVKKSVEDCSRLFIKDYVQKGKE
jgi:dihydroflavonol-4-reductase